MVGGGRFKWLQQSLWTDTTKLCWGKRPRAGFCLTEGRARGGGARKLENRKKAVVSTQCSGFDFIGSCPTPYGHHIGVEGSICRGSEAERPP